MSSLPEVEWVVAESQKEMMQDEEKIYAKVQHPEKWVSSWQKELTSLPEGEWAGAEFLVDAENEKNN